MPHLPDQFWNFLVNERKYFTNEHGNLLASAFSQAYRYLDFTDLIAVQIEKSFTGFISSNKKYHEMIEQEHRRLRTRDRHLTKKEEAQSRKVSRYARMTELEIESFYVFSRIFLDKTIHILELYFGRRRNCSFESFSGFSSLLNTLQSEHSFQIQPELHQIIPKLTTEIMDVRDKKIIHVKNARMDRMLTWDKTGRVSIVTGFHNPKPTDKFFRTADVRDLWKLLGEYSDLWINFVVANRQNSKLQFK